MNEQWKPGHFWVGVGVDDSPLIPAAFPDHSWAGNTDGHDCGECAEGSPWLCDTVAHRLGEGERARKLLAAVSTLEGGAA